MNNYLSNLYRKVKLAILDSQLRTLEERYDSDEDLYDSSIAGEMEASKTWKENYQERHSQLNEERTRLSGLLAI